MVKLKEETPQTNRDRIISLDNDIQMIEGQNKLYEKHLDTAIITQSDAPKYELARKRLTNMEQNVMVWRGELLRIYGLNDDDAPYKRKKE